MKRLNMYSSFALAVCLLGSAVFAAQQPAEQFDPKINTWAEGTILSLDVDGGKFSIRGGKKPYATAYARMTQDIYNQTRDLQGEKRDSKVAEVRNSWQAKLDTAQSEPSPKESDFTFYLPSKTTSLFVVDERKHYGKSAKKDGDSSGRATLSEDEAAAMKTLKDLKVGEEIVVGYESGIVYNTAYRVIRVSARNERDAAWTPAPAPNTGAAPKSDAEIASKIRLDIDSDKSLSSQARDAKVVAEDGKVTLKGTVKSESEKAKLESKAAAVVGADHVKNKLEVKP